MKAYIAIAVVVLVILIYFTWMRERLTLTPGDVGLVGRGWNAPYIPTSRGQASYVKSMDILHDLEHANTTSFNVGKYP